MKRLPFVNRDTHMTVIDYICRCGGKWTDHHHDLQGCEEHGGGFPGNNCTRFKFGGYMYEQARVEQEALRASAPAHQPVEDTINHHVR